MTDADLLRRILGAMRPDIPMDWHDQAWLAAKGLVTLEAIEADAAGVALAATPAPLTCNHDWQPWFANTSQCSCCGARRDDLATPAPLDVLVAARAVVEHAETDDDFDGAYIEWLVPEADIAALRSALAATPAPLDVLVAALEAIDAKVQKYAEQEADSAAHKEWTLADRWRYLAMGNAEAVESIRAALKENRGE